MIAMLTVLRSDTVSMIDFSAMWDDECASAHATASTTTLSPENDAFCYCIARSVAERQSIGESNESFSECMNDQLGNTASHWEKVAEGYRKEYEYHDWRGQYENEYKSKYDDDGSSSSMSSDSDSDDLDLSTTEGMSSTEQMESTESTEEWEWTSAATASIEGEGEEWSEGVFAVAAHDDRFGAAATYIGFLGMSILLFFCAWFVRGSLRQWTKGGYDAVRSSYESETDADVRGNPYGANTFDDEWDDDYNVDYDDDRQEEATKGKFWSQYSSI